MARKCRVELDEAIYRALRVEAAKHDMTAKDLASQIIKDSLDKSTFSYIESKKLVVAKGNKPLKPKRQKIPLREDEKAQQAIRDLWTGGEHNRTEIARKIGQNPRTVQEWIKDEIDGGRLEEKLSTTSATAATSQTQSSSDVSKLWIS